MLLFFATLVLEREGKRERERCKAAFYSAIFLHQLENEDNLVASLIFTCSTI
jgi:hypothetical protein